MSYPTAPMSQYPTPPAPPARRKTNAKILIIIGFVVTALASCGVGVGIGSSGKQTVTNSAAQPGPTVTKTVTAAAGATASPTTAKPTTKPGAATTFGDGTWEVGKDIAPGTYKTTVPADSSNCYWEREKSLDGSFDSVITNDNVNAGGHASVTIRSTDKGFKSDGCGTWRRS